MATTALNVGLTTVASATLPTAGSLATAPGTPPSTMNVRNQLGPSAVGWGELQSAIGGTNDGGGDLTALTTAWPALNAMSSPSGAGWLLDATLLAGQAILPGTWSGSLAIAINNSALGNVIADIWLRVAVYNATAQSWRTVGALSALAQTFTSAGGVAVALSGNLPLIVFGAGDQLYLDLFANVSSNASGIATGRFVVEVVPTSLVLNTGSVYSQFSTPGYQPLTELQAQTTAYAYGGFVLHDGVSYLVQGRPMAVPAVKQSLVAMARLEGLKKTGERVDAASIPVSLRVIGTSRADLESKLDMLYRALYQEQQHLVLHALDARYWIADCVDKHTTFQPARPTLADVEMLFTAQQPYAFAPSPSSYSTGNLAFGAVSGSSTSWQSGTIVIAGGGTIFARPTLLLTVETTTNNTSLTAALVASTPYTTLSVAALPSAATAGQVFILNDGAGHTQNVTLSAGAAKGATSISVVSFTANFSYPAPGTTCDLDTTVSAISITQNTDNQLISVSGLTTLGNGHYLSFIGDQLAQNGWTVTQDGNTGSLIVFAGQFPVMEPWATSWSLIVTANNQPTILCQWMWTARFAA